MASARVVIAQLSDTHFDGGTRTEARGRLVMNYLHDLPARLDAIVHTGDITDNGLPHEHTQAARVLVSRHPLYTCPGNHDGRTPYHWPLNQVHEIAGGEAVLVLCDSVILGRDDGFLADATLDWLASTLDNNRGRPALVCMHHPPVPLHHRLIDEIGLGAPQRLQGVLHDHPDVVAILCGHAHTPAASTFAGLPVLVAPGVFSTLLLPWEVPGELSFKTTVDFGQPPAVAFHVLDEDRRLTTHFRFIPD